MKMDVVEQMLCTVNVPYAVPATRDKLSEILSSGMAGVAARHFAVSLFTDVPESVWRRYLNEKKDEKSLRLNAALRLLDGCGATRFSRIALYLFLEKRKEEIAMEKVAPQPDRDGPPWRILFREALSMLDMAPELDGHWTFGGGTVLSLMLSHRESHDIDIFVDDPQLLGYLSPKFSGEERRYDETSNYIKIYRPEGEIDFILAPRLLPNIPLRRPTFEGRPVPCEHPLEIVAKKLHYRGDSFTVRDWFDLAVVAERYGLDVLCGFCAPILRRPLELPNIDDLFKLNLNARCRDTSILDGIFHNLERRLALLSAEIAREAQKVVARDDEKSWTLDAEREFPVI